MLSRISVEIDFENNNTPVIVINYCPSDDVRDKLLKNFLEQIGDNCECKIQYMTVNPLRKDSERKLMISPLLQGRSLPLIN